jgi:hypothetical protein
MRDNARVTTTIKCKSYRARTVDGGWIELEAEDLAPAGALPQLIKRTDCPARFACSLRHFDNMVSKAGIRPVVGLPVRFREADLLPLTQPTVALRPPAPFPKPAAKPVAAPSPSAPAKRKTRLAI